MYKKLFIIYNDMSNLDIDLFIQSRIAKPSPQRVFEETEVPGKEGKLYVDKGYSEDIELPPITFNFLSANPNIWDEDFRKAKRWLSKRVDEKLIFSDDLDYYYIVKKVNIATPERLVKRIGRFEVTFTCEPYCYLREGLDEINLPSFLYNDYEETFPIYKINGEGILNINCNGNDVAVNVGQNMTIDTKKGLCFREDGTPINNAMKGFYSDLKLLEGENRFSFTSGFDIKIIPNWRCV